MRPGFSSFYVISCPFQKLAPSQKSKYYSFQKSVKNYEQKCEKYSKCSHHLMKCYSNEIIIWTQGFKAYVFYFSMKESLEHNEINKISNFYEILIFKLTFLMAQKCVSPCTCQKISTSSYWWFPKLKLTFKGATISVWTNSNRYISRFWILNTTTVPKNDAERAVNRQPGYRAGNSYRRYFIHMIIQTVFCFTYIIIRILKEIDAWKHLMSALSL